MHPSSPSSSDPNAPYRAAIALLADCNFFADEPAEQPETTHATYEHSAIAGLRSREAPLHNLVYDTDNASSSSTSGINVGTLKDYLRGKGHNPRGFIIKDGTIKSRLERIGFSAENFLSALHIAYDPNHPLLDTLGISVSDQELIIYRLESMVMKPQGFNPAIRDCAQNSNNNPERLIRNLLEFVRYQNL